MDLLRPDGEHRHVQVATAPGRYAGEDIGQAVAVDITPMRRIHGALREERQFIDQALDTLPDVFVYLSPDGTLLRWNETAEEVTGYDAAALAEKQLSDLFVTNDVPALEAGLETAIETGRATVEARLLTRDGRVLPYEFRGRVLGYDSDEVEGLVGIGRDISGRRTRDRQLQIIDRLLRHNLRNAMTTILGRAESIRSNDDAVADSVDAIIRTSERLLSTADKERTVVRVLSERPTPVPTDVVSVVDDAVETITDRFPDAQVEWSPPERADARATPQLSDAVVELLDNAIRHNDGSAPTVDVAIETTDDTVWVDVSDEGPLIPDAEVSAIADDALEDQLRHGQGLGLWLVSLVARSSGGSVVIGEREPRGNVVSLELQQVEADRSDATSVSAPE